jgi:hypothetical protein
MRALYAVLLFVFAAPVYGQDQTKPDLNSSAPNGPCWEIYSGNKDAAPYAALLLNKCDGRSWVLVKDPAPVNQGKESDAWTWRWTPLNADQNEAVLSVPNLFPPPHK